jgi:predicted nucleotidyltransferase
MAYRQGLMERTGSSHDPVTDGAPASADDARSMRKPTPAMTDEQMRRYLAEVGNRLEARGLVGEIVLAGGAVMVMALHARGGSRDIDAVFVKEADGIRDAAREVARAHGLPDAWLNDQVRVFVAPGAPTVELIDVPGLRVRMVRLDYLFYMKAWAGDPIDQRDLRVIANALELKDEHQASEIVRGFSPGELPRDVEILLESLFE